MRIARSIPIVLAGVLALVAFSAAPAFAKEIHVYSGTSFGKEGGGNGEFKEPAGVAVSEVGAAKGDVYVVDKGNGRVEVFSSAGAYVSQFNGSAAPTGAFSSPEAIAVDNDAGSPSQGDVYVTDRGHETIDKLSAGGVYLCQIRGPKKSCLKEASEETQVEKEAPAFNGLLGVAVDLNGMVWVYTGLQEEAEDGEVDSYSNALANVFASGRKSNITGVVEPGFAVDSEDNLYVVHRGRRIVAKLDSAGELLPAPGEELGGEGPKTGIAVDLSNNDVYLDSIREDEETGRKEFQVEAFTADGSLLETFGSGQLADRGGVGLAVNAGSPGKPVYVADDSTDTISVFTEAVVPDVSTEAATSVKTVAGASSATLHGAVTPDETSVTGCEFEYGPVAAGEYTQTAPCAQTPAEINTLSKGGKDPVPVTAEVSGLSPTTAYHFRLVASNSNGADDGSEVAFNAPAAPTIGSESVTALNSAEPKLEAKINPDFQATTYRFEYATNEALTENLVVVPGATLPAVFEEVLAGPVGLKGLRPVTYYYRVVAENKTSEEEGKPVYGPVEHFVALAAPAVTTSPAGEPTRTVATISGNITPQGLPSTYHFAYIPLPAYEAAVGKGAPDPFATAFGGHSTHETPLTQLNEENHVENIVDYTAHPVAVTLEELAPETTYVYALVAHNELGTTTSAPQTFTTAAPTPPLVATGGAVGVTQSSATITGSVDTRGLQTSAQFEFGTNPTPGQNALVDASVTAGSEGESGESIEASLSGVLLPGVTYYYRVVATNRDGSSDGAEQSFTTPGFPAVLAPATVLPFVPYTSLAELQARQAKEGKATAPTSKSLTRGEKLAKALRACRGKARGQRAACERRARRQYGSAGKKRGKR